MRYGGRMREKARAECVTTPRRPVPGLSASRHEPAAVFISKAEGQSNEYDRCCFSLAPRRYRVRLASAGNSGKLPDGNSGKPEAEEAVPVRRRVPSCGPPPGSRSRRGSSSRPGSPGPSPPETRGRCTIATRCRACRTTPACSVGTRRPALGAPGTSPSAHCRTELAVEVGLLGGQVVGRFVEVEVVRTFFLRSGPSSTSIFPFRLRRQAVQDIHYHALFHSASG